MCDICGIYPCASRCPNANEPKVRGYCKQCTKELTEDYEYYEDSSNNKFCSCECACEFHGIKSKDWE